MKKMIIHVDQHVIRANHKTGECKPPLTCKTYDENHRAQEAIIRDADGNEVCRVVHRPNEPLSCGARVWIETPDHSRVELIT